jgi:hypothetical protein
VIVLPIVLTSTLMLRPVPMVTTAPDTLIDVGGHELRFEVREGPRLITVVLEAGRGAAPRPGRPCPTRWPGRPGPRP